jgi:hypothetical protein
MAKLEPKFTKDKIENIIIDSLRTCKEEDMPTDNYITHILSKFKIKTKRYIW